MGRISLLSVVRPKDGDQYMGIVQIHGLFADCAWIKDGHRHTARFPLADLEVVPALSADDARWRQAFTAVGHKKVG